MTGNVLQYYTDRVDESLAQTVRGIKGQHTQFATERLGNPDEDFSIRSYVQLKAWCRPDGGWQIDRYTMLGVHMRNAVKKEPESKTGLCFFDALEYCATFQMTQMEMGKVAFPVADEKSTYVSLKEAATAAGQVIDMDGRLHPCAFGQILGAGFFSEDDIAVAESTMGKDVASVETLPMVITGTDLLPLAPTIAPVRTNQDIIKYLGGQKDLSRIFREVIHTGTKMMDSFDGAINTRFQSGLENAKDASAFLVLSVITLGIMPVKATLRGDAELMPIKGYGMAKDRFMKAVQALPDGGQRNVFNEFAKTVEIGFQMEHGVALWDPEEKSASVMRKALSQIDAACKLAGYNEADAHRVKQTIIDGGVKRGDFYKKIAPQWDPFLTEIPSWFCKGVGMDWADFYELADQLSSKGPDHYSPDDVKKQFQSLEKKVRRNYWDGLFTAEAFPKFCEKMSDNIGRIDRDKPSLARALYLQIPGQIAGKGGPS